MKLCPNCGVELFDEAVFCGGCGKKITDEIKPEKKQPVGMMMVDKIVKKLIERERRIKEQEKFIKETEERLKSRSDELKNMEKNLERKVIFLEKEKDENTKIPKG